MSLHTWANWTISFLYFSPGVSFSVPFLMLSSGLKCPCFKFHWTKSLSSPATSFKKPFRLTPEGNHLSCISLPIPFLYLFDGLSDTLVWFFYPVVFFIFYHSSFISITHLKAPWDWSIITLYSIFIDTHNRLLSPNPLLRELQGLSANRQTAWPQRSETHHYTIKHYSAITGRGNNQLGQLSA